MNNFLFKTFIKNYENVKDSSVRDSYGKLAGIVGIVSNTILCLIKMAIGLISGSIAIIADAVNNLADASSSLITLVGFKLASLPEDEDHPYGHARIEYLAGLMVSVMIIVVGLQLGKSSIEKILSPEPIVFSWSVILGLVIAIVIKIWQASFNVAAGKRINSITLIATATDSRNDVISTSCVLVSIIIGYLANIQIDGFMGVLVALFIIWSGISLVKETISPLLGESPDPQLVLDIEEKALSYEGVLGIHDLVVHNYGPGKIFASIHIEVDSAVDIMESHDLVDTIEHAISKDFGILLTAHMDPVKTDDPSRKPLSEIISREIEYMEGVLGFHDLRIVPGNTHTNIIFDVVISPECKIPTPVIKERIEGKVSQYDKTFFCVIEFDKAYVKTE